ncbi:MAG: ribosome-associated translation inhibitor RaiA [Oscillospiraceae bacterium]|nr:ribosome-associated translation inhibitor RaiA [Oscillospiraceae bacterium]
MTVKITSKDVRITPDIEKTAEKKISQRLKKHTQKQGENQVIVVKASEKKPFIRVDVDMPYLNYTIHAEAITPDGILGGVDKCMDILERQIDKYKTRMHRSKVKTSSLKRDILDIVTDDMLSAPSAPAPNDDEPDYKIVKAEGRPQPMNIDEAILQMEVLEYKFLFFLNAETDTPSVIYRRDDGNIGLIET